MSNLTNDNNCGENIINSIPFIMEKCHIETCKNWRIPFKIIKTDSNEELNDIINLTNLSSIVCEACGSDCIKHRGKNPIKIKNKFSLRKQSKYYKKLLVKTPGKEKRGGFFAKLGSSTCVVFELLIYEKYSRFPRLKFKYIWTIAKLNLTFDYNGELYIQLLLAYKSQYNNNSSNDKNNKSKRFKDEISSSYYKETAKLISNSKTYDKVKYFIFNKQPLNK